MDTHEGRTAQLKIRRPTIMVVDDDADVRESFCIILEDNYNLFLAASGEEALTELRGRKDIRMVFLDYQLPGMNGLDFLKALQQLQINVPVVMVTGRGTRDTAVKAFQYDVEDYITKPFRVRDIQNIVMKIIEKSKPRKSSVTLAKECIIENLDEKLTTLEIAYSAGTRYRQLMQQFKVDTGSTMVEFRNVKRIELAKKYLRDKDWTIQDIAVTVGFIRQNYFSYIFRKNVGMTPSAYRKQFRKYTLNT